MKIKLIHVACLALGHAHSRCLTKQCHSPYFLKARSHSDHPWLCEGVKGVGPSPNGSVLPYFLKFLYLSGSHSPLS